MMDFDEALRMMTKGYRVQLPEWKQNGAYITITLKMIEEEGKEPHLAGNDVTRRDWQVVQK